MESPTLCENSSSMTQWGEDNPYMDPVYEVPQSYTRLPINRPQLLNRSISTGTDPESLRSIPRGVAPEKPYVSGLHPPFL